MAHDQRDVFISYASENRDEVVGPLAELLTHLGVSVWFDKFDLKLGDSLRQKIDAGLLGSRFGVVILSRPFFSKHYPNVELNGLAQREVGGQKVILPVWVGIDESDVRDYSLPLADRIAARWEDGLTSVAAKIIEVVRPDILEELRSNPPFHQLKRIRSGRELGAVIGGVHFSYHYNDDAEDEVEAEGIASFVQEVHDWSEIWDDIEPADQIRTQFRLGELLSEMEGNGWTVFGGRKTGDRKVNGVSSTWTWYVLAVLRGEPVEVLHTGDDLVVARADAKSASA